jgi:hypothetical protein
VFMLSPEQKMFHHLEIVAINIHIGSYSTFCNSVAF